MRNICLSIMLLLLSGCASSEDDRPLNPAERAALRAAGTCVSGNCQDGEGVWKYEDGRRYEGAFIAGRPGGTGIVYMTTGSEFSGRFKYGQYDGYGDVLYGNGVYADCQRGNCINGRGVLLFEDGSRYSGEFRDEIRTGHGGMELLDGSTYSGNFLNDLYHEKGTITLPDGTEYRGPFKKGYMNGEINIRFASGHKFIGMFKNGEMVEGQGRIIFPNSVRANCEDGNCITGEGTLEFDNGSIYTGDFLDCSRHGYGIHTFDSRAVYEGNFLNGKRHGKGSFTFSSGIKFEGEYRDGMRHGRGRVTLPDGTVRNVLYRKGKLVERKF